jgi:predicted O-methyltransferase YrrM
MNKWIRRKRNSWGYGVQSPNDFYFVQHVLREKSPYYNYATIEELEKKHSDSLPFYSSTINKLLFRLADYAHTDSIIEVGAGLSTLAIALGHPFARCIAITSSDSHHKTMTPLLEKQPHVEVKNGDEMAIFLQVLKEFGTIGMLHIAHTELYQEIVSAALPHVTDNSLIIIEDICSDKAKHNWWKSLQESPKTGITYDLGSIGLVFFNRSRHKETYWINIRK